MSFWFFTIFLLTLFAQHMTSPVPNGNGEDKEAYEEVKELESLRNENSRTNKTEHNHQIDSTPGKATPQSASSDEVEPQTNSRSAIFRHRGITQAKKSKYWNDKVEQARPKERYTKYAGIQYSPTDLAEYVFSTGDEEGVAVAVEELVREGMMGRTDAINYLQDVKQMLAYMKEQYDEQKKLQEMKNMAYPKPQVSQRLQSPPREQFFSHLGAEKREPKDPELASSPIVITEHPHQDVIASTSEPKGLTHSASTTVRPKTDSPVAEVAKDDDYKRRSEYMENYDFTLQVIFKLAKDMFTESIAKDDPVAEDTLSGLVTFMENEVENKRISSEMKQRVLAVVSNALVDSLREYQRMIPENQPQPFDEGNFYQHLSGQSGVQASKMDLPAAYRKLTVGG